MSSISISENILFAHRSLTKWWDDDVIRHLPVPCNEMRKLCCEIIGMQGDSSSTIEMVDPYHDYNRPFEYTVLMECFEFKVRLVGFLLLVYELLNSVNVTETIGTKIFEIKLSITAIETDFKVSNRGGV